jgi:hypothetical protein
VNTNRGPDHKESDLLMADQNPTGGGQAVPLDLPAPHLALLRQTLTSCLVGVKDDLASAGETPNAERAREEADAYRRVLRGLHRGEVIVPDEPAREAIAILAAEADRENNYAEVVAGHDALHGLLGVLEGAAI